MNIPDHIHPIAVEEALLNIGMTTNEIRALTGNTAPQIIRTDDDYEALDPDSLVLDRKGRVATPRNMWRLPAVVVATAEQVRAARKALEEA